MRMSPNALRPPLEVIVTFTHNYKTEHVLKNRRARLMAKCSLKETPPHKNPIIFFAADFMT